jgi:hypothetical protein
MSAKAIVIAGVAGVAVAVWAISLVTGHGDEFGVSIGMLAIFAAYWLPTFIAASRGIPNAVSVAVVNLCLAGRSSAG